ncbi:MAG: MbnP family protein [Chitinophagaceae bacterium]
MRSSTFFSVLIFLVLSITGCKKDDNSTDGSLANMSIEFDNIIGGQNLFLNTVTYKNSRGEDYTISRLQYFISNLRLTRSDGTDYTIPQDSSYFLIRESEPDTRFVRIKIPAGDYTNLRFIVGVDSLRSTMDISRRTGVLDPTGGMEDGMYWSWNSGYIFFKMEGDSPAAPVDPAGNHKYRFHIGGFGGYTTPTINNIREVNLDLRPSGLAQARQGRQCNIHLMADVAKVMDGSTSVSLATNSSVMFGDFSGSVANNYSRIFFHDHTEN